MAIEASLREMDKARPSAPHGLEEPEYKVGLVRPGDSGIDLSQPLPTFDLAPRESETILTFSNTLDQMAAYGERDLRRFPHAHVLYEQAYALGGKLQRNAEEKSTKQRTSILLVSDLSADAVNRNACRNAGQIVASRRALWQHSRWPASTQSTPTAGTAATAVSATNVLVREPTTSISALSAARLRITGSSDEWSFFSISRICPSAIPAAGTVSCRPISLSYHADFPGTPAILASAELSDSAISTRSPCSESATILCCFSSGAAIRSKSAVDIISEISDRAPLVHACATNHSSALRLTAACVGDVRFRAPGG